MGRRMNLSKIKIRVLVVAFVVAVLALARAVALSNTVESKSPFKIVSSR